MRRGFKAQAERLALSIRTDMGLGPAEPVRAATIAEHLGIEVRPADQLIARARLQELQDLQYNAFSGATFRLPSGRTVVDVRTGSGATAAQQRSAATPTRRAHAEPRSRPAGPREPHRPGAAGMSHHPLCMTLWSGEPEHCECPEVNTCRSCAPTCKQCTWEQETCDCYEHEEQAAEDEGLTP